MTTVMVEPGACGFRTKITALGSDDSSEVTLRVSSGCGAVQGMMEALGSTFDAYALCLSKPGKGPFYDYAGEHFPGHAACPVIAGITKCAEAECGLALKRDATIHFVNDAGDDA